MIVELTYTDKLLGTLAGDPEIATEHILNKHPNGKPAQDEVESLETAAETLVKGSTVFHKMDDGTPLLYDYMIKGFFKDAASMLNRALPKDKQLKAHKKIIDGLIFPKPRQIKINLSGGITICERPLRGQTAQGERIALVRSEAAPAGSTIRFEIHCLDEKLFKAIRSWLDYGEFRGMGQWRNSGKGRFTWREITSA